MYKRQDEEIYQINKVPVLEKNIKRNISVLVDQLLIDDQDDCRQRLTESIETALRFSNGSVDIQSGNEKFRLSNKHSCPVCNFSLQELEPKIFSFNNPSGACEECDGLGTNTYFDEDNKQTILEKGNKNFLAAQFKKFIGCLLYTSPSPRDRSLSRMPSSA